MGYCFGASLNLKFTKNISIMSFYSIQGEEKSLADFTVRESLGNQLQNFQLAFTQWLGKGLIGHSNWRIGFNLAGMLLYFKCMQQLTDIGLHYPSISRFRQKLSHRSTFVDEDTDEACRLCHRQCAPQQFRSFIRFTMGI